MILEYTRSQDRQKTGVVVVDVKDNKLLYAYSFVNSKAGDRFNQELGRKIAFARLAKKQEKLKNASILEQETVHKAAQPIIQKLMEKGLRYFKGSRLGIPIPKAHH